MTSLPAVRNIVNIHVAGFKKYFQAMKKVHCLAHKTHVRGVSKHINLSSRDNFPTGIDLKLLQSEKEEHFHFLTLLLLSFNFLF